MIFLRQANRRQGFSLVELLAVVATIAILAALLLPVLGKARVKAQQARCMSNLRQLGFAWVMYFTDNNGRLVESYPVNNSNAWVLGDMTKSTESTNTGLLAQSKLYHYNRSFDIYHCPADQGVKVAGRILPSVRSYSMNAFMGARDANLGPIPNFADQFVSFYAKESDLKKPASLWVLLDEDERSINDGFFVPDPTGRVWIDFPANSAHRHNFSFALNFADQHSEIWRLQDPRTKQVSSAGTEQYGNHDLERLARASATLK